MRPYPKVSVSGAKLLYVHVVVEYSILCCMKGIVAVAHLRCPTSLNNPLDIGLNIAASNCSKNVSIILRFNRIFHLNLNTYSNPFDEANKYACNQIVSALSHPFSDTIPKILTEVRIQSQHQITFDNNCILLEVS